MKKLFQLFLIITIFLTQIIVVAQEQPELIIPLMHDKRVNDASYSPDGKFVTTCSDDNIIKLWNTSNGKLLRNFLGHGDHVVSIDFNSDGTKLLSASNDSTVILWDVMSGKVLQKLKLSNPKVNQASFSPNEEKVLVSFNYSSSAQIWDLQNDSIIHNLTIPFHKISSAEYSSDGKFILTYYNGYYESNSYNSAQIWDAEKGILLHNLIGHENTITSAKFTLDNKKIITASKDESIKIWEIESGKLLSTFTNNILSDNNYFDLSYDGQKIIIASGKSSLLEIDFTTKSEKIFEVTNKYDSKIFRALYSHNDKNVMAVSTADRIIKFDRITGSQIQTINWEHAIIGVKISPDGDQMISYGNYKFSDKENGSAVTYNVETGQKLIKLGEKLSVQNPQNASISSSGKYMCQVLNDFSHIIDMKTGNILHILEDRENPFYYKDVTVEFSPNDSLLAIINRGKGYSAEELRIWDVSSGQLLHSKIINNKYINSFVFSKDSKLILTSSGDNTANIWEAKTGKLIHSIKHKNVEFADLSPDSKYAITTSRSTIKIWSVESGKIFQTIDEKIINLSNEKYFIPKVGKFSPDGKYIAISTYIIDYIDKNIISILDANTYELIRTIKYDEKNPCSNIIFSTDSKKLIVTTRIFHGGSYQTMREFEVETGKLITMHDLKGGFLSCVDWKNQRYIVKRNSKIVFCNLKDDSEILSRIVTRGYKEAGGGVFMETLTINPNGHFDGDQSLFSKLYFANKLETIPLESYFEEFYTPNLWERTLKGDTIEKTIINLETQKPLPLVAFIQPPKGKINFRGDSNASLITDKIDYELEYSIIDQGGGINEVRVFQNGKLIYNELPKINELNKKFVKKLPIKLNSGTNNIIITAFNDDRIEKSENAIIEFTGQDTEPSRLFMLCIGINEYQKNSYNLNFAVPDASSFLDAINTGSKDLFSEVILDSIKNKDATKSNILLAIKKIQANCKPNDVFIFYYAGHGVMNEDVEAKSSLYYIIPHEITNFYSIDMLKKSGISANEITEFSKEIKAQKQIFILDACQSGGALNQIASRGAVEEKAIAVLARSTGTYFLVASNSEQLASEFAALGHGVFTYSLLLGLTGQADSDQDKKISIKELSMFVESKVPELSEQFKGNAQYPASYGYGQDFPISLSDKYKMENKISVPLGKYSSYSLEELIKMKAEAIKAEEFLKAEELKIEIGKRK